jgi:hypothetical protein
MWIEFGLGIYGLDTITKEVRGVSLRGRDHDLGQFLPAEFLDKLPLGVSLPAMVLAVGTVYRLARKCIIQKSLWASSKALRAGASGAFEFQFETLWDLLLLLSTLCRQQARTDRSMFPPDRGGLVGRFKHSVFNQQHTGWCVDNACAKVDSARPGHGVIHMSHIELSHRGKLEPRPPVYRTTPPF